MKRRLLLRGPRLPLRPPGINGAIRAHCSSVRPSESTIALKADLQKSALNHDPPQDGNPPAVKSWLRPSGRAASNRAVRGDLEAERVTLAGALVADVRFSGLYVIYL